MAHPVAGADASVHALDHAVVQSTDGNATKALFGDALGLRLAVDKEFTDWGARLMFVRVAGVTVEVASALAGVDAASAIPPDGKRCCFAGIRSLRIATPRRSCLLGLETGFSMRAMARPRTAQGLGWLLWAWLISPAADRSEHR